MKNKDIKRQLINDTQNLQIPDVLQNVVSANYSDYKCQDEFLNKSKKADKVDFAKAEKPTVRPKRKLIPIMALAAVFVLTLAIALPLALLNKDPDDPVQYTVGLQYTRVDDFYEVSLGTATDKDIKIAPEHEGLPVKQIAKDAFMNSDIESIVMPDSIITIIDGDSDGEIIGAFAGCDKLENITFSNNVTSIGACAFYGCINLKSITIPTSVTSIDMWAFLGCYSLTTIMVETGNMVYRSEGNCLILIESNELLMGCKGSIIPNSVTSIGDYAFYNCIGLTSITIPSSITSIGYYAFRNSTDLTSIIFEQSSQLVTIGEAAFAECGLTSIIIPDSVTSIDRWAFYHCYSLESVTIGSGVTDIGFQAFSWSINLQNIMVESANIVYRSEGNCLIQNGGNKLIVGCKNSGIPDSVANIGEFAFYGCINLTSITIPSNVLKIERAAFADCSGLIDVILTNGLTNIGGSAFSHCVDLTNIIIPNSVTIIDAGAFQYSGLTNVFFESDSCLISIGTSSFGYCTNLESITIPNSVKTISYWAFQGCSSLTSIIIPSSVTNIGSGLFSGCSNLINIEVEIGNTVYKGEGNCLIRIADNMLIAGCKNSIIPNSVTSIGEHAFRGTGLTSITIPSSITAIGDYAFLTYNLNDCTIYAEAEYKPFDWRNFSNNDNYSVVWGCGISEDINGIYVVTFTKTANNIEKASNQVIEDPYREGYIFGGWSTTEGSTTADYTSSNIKTAPNGTTLYVIWIAN